jgi:RND family efflux transporter MFP subunit
VLDQEKTKLDKLRDQPKVKPEDLDNARVAVQQAQAALTKTLADIDAGTIKGETNRDAAVRSAQLTLQQAQTNYDKLANSGVLPGDLQAQEQSVKLAELALQKAQTPRTDVDSARIAVAAAQSALDQLLAGASELELVALRTQIQAAELAVGNAQQAVGVAQAALAAAQAKSDQATRGPDEFTIRDLTNKIGLATNALQTAQLRLQNKIDSYAQVKKSATFDQETLRGAITQAQLDVQNYEAQTGDVKVIAPFAGKITRLAARPGDTVQAFFPILNLSGLEGLVIKADISEADLSRLSVGMPVDMTMDAYPNQALHGRIDTLPDLTVGQVGQAPDRATRIVVDWPGPGAELGMLARVQITLQTKDDVLMVPNGAVRTVGKRRFVEYMDGDIKRSRNVELGIVTDQDTEITSGLTEGMEILAGQS